jgi:acid phosphatase (class A)
MRVENGSVRALAAVLPLLLTACANAPHPQLDDQAYALPAAFDATWLLAPPPSAAEAAARDLEAVRAAQRTRTSEQSARAEASSTVDVFLFASVLGPRFTPAQLPVTAAFFSRVYRSALPFLQAAKDCWHRDRPFVVDRALEPLARSFDSTKRRSATGSTRLPSVDGSPCTAATADSPYSPSYPSGHATVGAMMAILLAELVPEQRAALFACGWEFGDARVIGGVHFPSDVEAGRVLGTLLVGMMQQDDRFRADLHVARRELRAVLGYP